MEEITRKARTGPGLEEIRDHVGPDHEGDGKPPATSTGMSREQVFLCCIRNVHGMSERFVAPIKWLAMSEKKIFTYRQCFFHSLPNS